MDKHKAIGRFTSGKTWLFNQWWWQSRGLALASTRIRKLEASPPKLAGARLEGPSQGWPA